MKRRNIILVSSLILSLAAAGLIILWRLHDPIFAYVFGLATPTQLKQARVVLGDSFLSRSQLVEIAGGFWEEGLNGRGIGSINDIAIRQPESRPDLRVVIAGHDGAIIVDRNGVKQSQIRYDLEAEQSRHGLFRTRKPDRMLGDIQIVDIDGDGGYQFLARGSFDGAALFDQQGRTLWYYRTNDQDRVSLKNVTVGDLKGDGQVEFIVSINGIEAFDRYGKQLWRRSAEYGPSQIEVVDTDGSGKKKIVSIGSRLEIRDDQGNETKAIESPAGYIGKFSLCAKPNERVPTILAINDGYLWLINFEGSAVAKFDAPLSDFSDVVEKTPYSEFGTSAYKAKGVWVKLVKDQPEYLAAIAEFRPLERSVLYVYTSSGTLVYQEVLPEECTSIAVLPSEYGQEFLVGGSRTVWRYKAK